MNRLFSDFLDDHLIQHVHPVVDARTYKIEFFEVLSRARYKGKIYQPKEFLEDITPWQKFKMAETILERIKNFQKLCPNASFSINVSALEMEDGLTMFLKKISKDEAIDPSRCIVEVLESSVISSNVIALMEELKSKYGYRFALDDFGAGYSNINQIYNSNGLFEYIKIDGSLVKDIVHDETRRIILSMVVLAIQASKKKAIVEHVTNLETLKAVEEVSPDYIQGFEFGAPAPIEEFMHKVVDGMILPLSLEEIKNNAIGV